VLCAWHDVLCAVCGASGESGGYGQCRGPPIGRTPQAAPAPTAPIRPCPQAREFTSRCQAGPEPRSGRSRPSSTREAFLQPSTAAHSGSGVTHDLGCISAAPLSSGAVLCRAGQAGSACSPPGVHTRCPCWQRRDSMSCRAGGTRT